MLQRQAIQKLHDDKRLILLLSNLIDRADIGMVQGGSCLRFPLKPGQRLGVFGYRIRQKLQCDEAVQLHVLSLVNNTHPATTELLDNAVVRDGFADQDWTCSGLPS